MSRSASVERDISCSLAVEDSRGQSVYRYLFALPVSYLLAAQTSDREDHRPRVPRGKPLVRPLPPPTDEDGVDRGHRYSIPERVQALTLLSLGYKPLQIEAWIGVKRRTAAAIWQKAKERGYNPSVDPRILLFYVEDGHRSGRPNKAAKTITTPVPSDR